MSQSKRLALYAVSIYARAVRDVTIKLPIPDEQVQVEKPKDRITRRNIPHHMAWSVMADSPESARRAGKFRALWMYPKWRGFVEWDVNVVCIDAQAIRAMLLKEEPYDWNRDE